MTTWDCSRKSLIDLLYDLIEPFIKKSFREEFQFPTPGEKAPAHRRGEFYKLVLSQVWGTFEGDDTFDTAIAMLSNFQTPPEPDDTSSLIAAIEELITDKRNDFPLAYGVGKLFGQSLAELERWQLGIHWEMNPCEVLVTEYRNEHFLWRGRCGDVADNCYRERVKRVLSSKCVQACPHAEMILNAERVSRVDSTNPICGDFTLLLESQAAVSLAMGAVLGTMYQGDNEAYTKDAASATPRMFMLSPEATVERVKYQVYAAEKLLDERTGRGFAPEQVISFSQNVIEGLTKDLWGLQFSQQPRKGELRNVLQEHINSLDENERRFSRLALALYDVYRKPAQHNLREFQCTWEEARFFHTGMRALVELSDKIKAKNKKQ